MLISENVFCFTFNDNPYAVHTLLADLSLYSIASSSLAIIMAATTVWRSSLYTVGNNNTKQETHQEMR